MTKLGKSAIFIFAALGGAVTQGCLSTSPRTADTASANALISQGMMLYSKGDLSGAQTAFSKAIAANPSSAIAYTNRGLMRYKMGDLDGSLDDHTKAIEIDPKLAEAYTNRGGAKLAKGDVTGAITDHTEALALKPKLTSALSNRGLAYLRQGSLDQALRDLDRALILDPLDPEAHANRAGVFLQKKNLAEAVKDSSKAIQLNPRLAEAYNIRGAAFYENGQLTDALADFNTAISLNPRLALAYLNRGILNVESKEYEKGIQDLNKGLELAPNLRSMAMGHIKKAEDGLRNPRSGNEYAQKPSKEYLSKTPMQVPSTADKVDPLRIVISNPKPDARTKEPTIVLVWNIISQMPISEWSVSLNGQVLPETRDLKVTPRRSAEGYRLNLDRKVALDPGANTIVLRAMDQSMTWTEEFLTIYRDNAQSLPPSTGPAFQGQRWAVVIGISRFQHSAEGIPNLRYADKDAQIVYEFLRSPQGGAFTADHIRFLTNDQATQANVRDALFDFLRQPIEEDLVIIFYAGHGVPEPGNPENLFLLTYDSDPKRLTSTAFPMWDLETTLRRFVKAKRVVVMTDACHSAGVGSDLGIRSRDNQTNLINRYLHELTKSGTGRAIFTAGEVNELSRESKDWGGGHGVFTHYLLEGLRGAGDTNDDGIVTLGEVMDYTSEQVRRATRNAQHPTTSGRFDRSMPMAVLR